jgi:hypothetical protein
MPGKHHQSSSFLARHRYPLVVGVVLLGIAVTGTLAAIDNRRDPSSPRLVSPSLSLVASPPASATSSVPVSAGPSSSPPPSRPPSRRPSPTPPPTPSRTAAAPSFSARYFATGLRDGAFRAGVLITNEGRSTREWRLVITYDPDDDVRVQGTLTFEGSLGAGERTSVGYRATTSAERTPRPASCRVNGRDCTILDRRDRNDSGGWRR